MRKKDYKRERPFVCGKCGHITPLTMDDRGPGVCPECGYIHGERDEHDTPDEVKLRIRI